MAKHLNKSDWWSLLHREREMTAAFMHYLSQQENPEDIANFLLSKMPRKTQQVLGSADRVTDLLELPAIPPDAMHRVTYGNIPTQHRLEDIISVLDPRRRNKVLCKAAVPNAEILDTNSYVGSTKGSRGAKDRLGRHQQQSNKCLEGGILSTQRIINSPADWTSCVTTGFLQRFRTLGS